MATTFVNQKLLNRPNIEATGTWVFTTINCTAIVDNDEIELFDIPENCLCVGGFAIPLVVDGGTQLDIVIDADTQGGPVELIGDIQMDTDILADAITLNAAALGTALAPLTGTKYVTIQARNEAISSPDGDGSLLIALEFIRIDYDRS